MNSIYLRLKEYADSTEISIRQIELKAGLGNDTIGKLKSSPEKNLSGATFGKIEKAFNNLNIEWVRTGKGPMLKTEKSTGLLKAEKLLSEEADYLRQIEELKKQIRDKDELLEFYRKNKGK